MFNNMFDELEEVKHFKEIIDFQNLILNVNYFKEIKRLKSLQKVEAHLEPKQASMIELFVNILNGLLSLEKKHCHSCLTGLCIDLRKY